MVFRDMVERGTLKQVVDSLQEDRLLVKVEWQQIVAG